MMEQDIRNITGVILAGGNSSRMGTNKAFLMIHNKPMITHIYELLETFFPCIVISTSQPELFAFLDAATIADETRGLGPMGGIFSCLKSITTEKAFVTACDLPFINRELIRLIVQNSADFDFVVPSTDKEKLEPLCAVYDKNMLNVMAEMIRMNDLSLQHLKNKCNTKVIYVKEELQNYNDKLFQNINTSSDFEKYIR